MVRCKLAEAAPDVPKEGVRESAVQVTKRGCVHSSAVRQFGAEFVCLETGPYLLHGAKILLFAGWAGGGGGAVG